VDQGNVSPRQLLEIILQQQKKIDELRAELKQARDEIAKLKEEAARKNPTQRLDEEYSLKAEEKRSRRKRKRKQKSKRRGRRATAEKLAKAERSEIVLPEGFSQEDCTLHRSRPVWRIEHGRAVLVAYHIYRGPGGELPPLPGLLSRCEYGLEILVALAFLVFIVRLSMDKVCAELAFFWELNLSKSQADALLNRLTREWEPEFDALCELLAHSAVVHADETSWSINSVWAFLSEKVRLLLFGVHKDGATLAALLPKDLFAGVLVSDDAAVYRNFTRAQKCWAHLIRKAIKLTLLHPENAEYRRFLDGLLALYGRANRIARDKRLRQQTRRKKVGGLEDELRALCESRYQDDREPTTEAEADYLRLVKELMRLLEAEELFTFVIHAEVDGTNNEAERGLRDAAQDRDTGRTSKTIRGARRRTVATSVLESLRLYLPTFTLRSVLEEVNGWFSSGRSRFRVLLDSLGVSLPAISPLDVVLPLPDD
ncbi:MAG: transposase, partial [Planctomycetes bacterium]|nr:transposase [Planctomycetota bacterium]